MGYLKGFTHESVWGWVKANIGTHAGEAFHKLPGQISTLVTAGWIKIYEGFIFWLNLVAVNMDEYSHSKQLCSVII